jgi:hypothetical protein
MGNAAPTFSNVPQNEFFNGVATANTNLDGTGTIGTDIYLVFTSAATWGSYLQSIVVSPRGTNVATVLRVFLNNGSANTTPANNVKIAEITLPASTASAVAQLPTFEVSLNRAIAPGFRVLVTVGTTVAGGYAVTAFGGSYVP